MVNVKGLDLFPTKIFKCKFIATEEMTDYIKDNQKAAMHTHVSNLVKQSKNNNLQKENIFNPFVKQIYSVTKGICQIYEYECNKIDITSMWINISEPHAAHPPHTHSNNVFSGVWYPCENINTSDIQFFDPRPQANQLTPKRKTPNKNNSGLMSFNSNKDTMYMFPAWLSHWVPPTPNKRISISFNVILRGKYGEENTLQNANI